MTPSQSLDHLFADLLAQQRSGTTKLPPVHLWDPPTSGIMDLVVDREGRWIHEGGEIKRERLVKLFSTILKREGEHYFLVTPVEKWQIRVDFAPFYIMAASRENRDSQQAISLTTSTGETVVISAENPLWVDDSEGTSDPIPLVTVRGNLPGLVSRTVFYQLVEWGHPGKDGGLYVESMGSQFLLGMMD
ncbi:DUF1285 domain-containing protein [SAR92 clade bacterium H921]|jgi:hypothetical protein|nr:DUF1285 domain-containing protein [SAR92 clade bacterium H921]MDG0970934.1 DUF1285 domain-containing protein [Porticoccaceae bacterium]MDG1307421.1 DUF1285 domain-containing protein [Porticoccaceae bacterium]